MECLNCGAPVLENGHCSNCGLSYDLLKKAYNTSNFYYNLGLDRASVRDLTGAIDALNLALKYNKQNVNARNLLGLIYYEMGETVMGLTQWVISSSYLPDEKQNVAIYYMNRIQSDPRQLEDANQLAKQFNQALNYAKQGTKDLAFIQLRRILSSYPHFVKGYLLLALLYADGGNYDKAKKALKRVLRIDKNNTTAVRYLKEMGIAPRDVIEMKEKSARIDVNSAYVDEDQYKSELETYVEKGLEALDAPDESEEALNQNGPKKTNLMYVVVGLVLGISVFWILLMPTKLSSANKTAKQQQKEYSESLAQKDIEISDLESKVAELTNSIDDVKKEAEDEKEKASKNGPFEVIKKNMPNTTYESLCSLAATAISEGRYGDAIDMCNAALQVQEGDAAYYYLGRAYLGSKEEEKANVAFSSLRDNYPDSDYIDYLSDDSGEEDVEE